MCKVHLSVALDRRLQSTKDQRYNVKVIVYYNPDGKQLRRRCNTHCYLTDAEFKKMYSCLPKTEYINETRIKIDKFFAEIKTLVDKMGDDFSFERFDQLFQQNGLAVCRGRPSVNKKKVENKNGYDDNVEHSDLFSLFESYIKELSDMKRFGTADSYKSARNALYSFRSDLMLQDLTPSLLYSFEEAMMAKGLSISTIGIYTRSLRTIVNLGIAENLMPHEKYPFGSKRKRKYQIPYSRNLKKALDVEDIRLIKNATLLKRDAEFARDIWLFSFYCNGMNMADIFFLKYENINGNYLRFLRKKTINTQRDRTPIEAVLVDPAKEIINRWGNKDTSPGHYIFSDIQEIYDQKRLYELKGNFTRSINYHMRELAKQLNIERTLTTNVARHSFATVLKNLGVATEQISECLGHSDIKTTKFYLDSFSDDHKINTAQLLAKVI